MKILHEYRWYIHQCEEMEAEAERQRNAQLGIEQKGENDWYLQFLGAEGARVRFCPFCGADLEAEPVTTHYTHHKRKRLRWPWRRERLP